MRTPVLPRGAGGRHRAWGEFAVLPETVSAVRAARRVAGCLTRPGRPVPPNPLVLHGPPGVGKTMLVGALARKLIDHPKAIAVRVVPARELPTSAADADELTELNDCDLVAVEDVQHLPVRSAGELCRLLDRRAARRRPTVLTATAGPAGLTRLPRRLTSRLAAGLVIQLEPLAPASRRTLLERLAKKRNLRLTGDALDWLAKQVTGGGARPLVGQVERLRSLTRGKAKELNAAAVRRLLKDDAPAGPGTVKRIIDRVAAAFGVKPKDVTGSCRQRAVLVPRQVAMYLTREVAKLSLPQIGAAFGRDHSTVLHAIRKVEAAMKDDAKLRATVRTLKRELG